MSSSDKLQAKAFESVEFEDLNQRERLVVQMFRQLNQQQQKDILRFFDVLLGER